VSKIFELSYIIPSGLGLFVNPGMEFFDG